MRQISSSGRVWPFGQPDAGQWVERLADGVEEDREEEDGQPHVGDVVQVDGVTDAAGLHLFRLVLESKKNIFR